ncbi:MAG: LacI family DNA-binding transcriptional regulator, partial [Armatimonadetes bacterium]|nr:LacI family DNA-binding transcriptional regulator [Armatimonadota bacterium]
MPSIKDVAAAAQVSLGTVSKVLNERSDANISPATRERIRIAALRMGYHPSALARGLAGKRMNTIGVVMAYSQDSVTSDPYLGPCLDGILAQCKSRQQKVMLFLEGEWSDAVGSVPSYGEGHCDGLLIVIPRLNSPFLARLRERHPRLPFVLIGDSREDDPMPCVDINNVEAARLATAHLVARGHRRIAAFSGNHDFCSNYQRMNGYRQALHEAGIVYDPRYVFSGEYHGEWGERNAYRLLDELAPENRPTAVFCFCDAVAVGALTGFAARGVGVPEQVSVIGIDDIPRAADLKLTTIRQSIRNIGATSVQTLLDLLADNLTAVPRVLIEPQLVERESVSAGPYFASPES